MGITVTKKYKDIFLHMLFFIIQDKIMQKTYIKWLYNSLKYSHILIPMFFLAMTIATDLFTGGMSVDVVNMMCFDILHKIIGEKIGFIDVIFLLLYLII